MKVIRCKFLFNIILPLYLSNHSNACNRLQSRIEALDFDVEKAAEEELYQGSIDNHSTHSSL